MSARLSAKQAAILRTLAAMLEHHGAGRITTAALAREMNQSEAALYRHYASKAAMFEGLIAMLGELILEDMNHVEATEAQGKARLRKQVHALLLFVERHPGAAHVLTGGALANESPALQEQVNVLLQDVEGMLVRSARLRIEQEQLPNDANAIAAVLLHYVLGRWLRYAHSGRQAVPTSDLSLHLPMLGL
ncbi:nucleoid occlusion factor SlmA [Pusillimonas sp.]|uniref:nucleoid occlusion factor SlmA n=1 Tax=Pusillimonas sp. TaxID=3040095 RepID=UPI0029BF7DE3|nr:nucleoid occlusion factor SlmA [Pusillimonas sp.]MDX3894723.1 nucleoid occlusion factor SlmA [Pusillimonas sp.]